MAGPSRQDVTRAHPVGVVDIGSNSIRIVVFDAPKRAPSPVFNEKTFFMSDEFSLLDCMLAPILFAYGSPEQQARFLKSALLAGGIDAHKHLSGGQDGGKSVHGQG